MARLLLLLHILSFIWGNCFLSYQYHHPPPSESCLLPPTLMEGSGFSWGGGVAAEGVGVKTRQLSGYPHSMSSWAGGSQLAPLGFNSHNHRSASGLQGIGFLRTRAKRQTLLQPTFQSLL